VYLFTILGLIVSHKSIDFEYRRATVVQVMENLVNKLSTCEATDKDRIGWNIRYITVFTKGFQSEVS
jgi:hypothetical protein